MYQPGTQYDLSLYAAQTPQQQRPSSALSQQQFQVGGNNAYGQQQQSQANGGMTPAAMYAPQGGAGMAPYVQQQPGQPFASSSAGYGATAAPQPYQNAQGVVSTSALLQQQLAQQAAMNQQGSPAPSSAPQYASPHQNQQHAYQQLYQSRQQSQQPMNSAPSLPVPPTPSYSQPPPPTSTPSQPLSSSTGRSTMSVQEIQNALRGVQIQGMTPERFNTLQPHQQAALREYMSRTKAAQQAQLGLGMPSSPASNASTPSRTPNGSAGGAGAGSSVQNNAFLKTLSDFYAKKGQPFAGAPMLEGRPVDLAKMFASVTKAGGYEAVTSQRWWNYIAQSLGYAAPSPQEQPPDRVQALQQAYQQLLVPFEQTWAQMQQLRQQQLQAQNARNGAVPPQNGSPAAAPSPAPTVPPQTPASASQYLNAVSNAPTPSANAPSPFATSAPTPASQPAPQPIVDLTMSSAAASPSPFATGTARPMTGSSQRDGTAPPGTAVDGSMPPPFLKSDFKGKGKATDDGLLTVKTEPGLVDGLASPIKPASSTLPDPTAPSSSSVPPASSNAEASSATAPKPSEPPAPLRRKRRKIEYVPLVRAIDTYGGYDLGQLEQVHLKAEKLRRPRTLHDLGTVDIHALTMSLRCRLSAEISYALNALALIAQSMLIDVGDGHIPFPLSRCPDLLEELVDLLEETAFGTGDEDDDELERDQPFEEPAPFDPPTGYRDLFRLVADEASKLSLPSPADEREKFEPVKPVEVVLSVLNLLRNFSLAPDNAKLFGADRRLMDVLAQVSALPLKQERRTGRRYPLHVSPADSLAIKKDVLETLSTFALNVELAKQSSGAAKNIVDLVIFFLRDAHHRDQLHFDLSTTPSAIARNLVQPTSLLIPPYLELSLSTFSRLALDDSNRSAISRLLPSDTLYSLFESLIFLLPVSEADFQICTFEAGLVHVYHVAVSLYHLAYVAPSSVKLRLRSEPRFVRSLIRIVRRLAGSSTSASQQDLFVGLAQRCIGVLQLLSSLGGVSTVSSASAAETSDVPWWGLSMSGDTSSDDEERGSGGGGGGVLLRGTLPPSASGGGGTGQDAGAPVLAGDARILWELLQQGSMAIVFAQLVELADSTRGRRKRKREEGGEKEDGEGGEGK
ncbi:hypothetical protein JCM8547_000882 [Rhodosporidiobolus lusitaniae]